MKLLPTDPSDYEYGNNFNFMFPPGQTPKHLYVTLSGIIPVPPLPAAGTYNGTFKLTQSAYHPWLWVSEDTDKTLFLNFQTSFTRLYFSFEPGDYTVFYNDDVPKALHFFNGLTSPPTGHWYGGEAQVWWLEPVGPSSLTDVLNLMTIAPTEKIVGSVYPDGADHLIYLIVEREPDNPAGKFCKTASSRLRVKAELTS